MGASFPDTSTERKLDQKDVWFPRAKTSPRGRRSPKDGRWDAVGDVAVAAGKDAKKEAGKAFAAFLCQLRLTKTSLPALTWWLLLPPEVLPTPPNRRSPRGQEGV